MMSGHRYEVRMVSPLRAFAASVFKRRPLPPLILANKKDNRSYSIPVEVEAQLHAMADKYTHCEWNRFWPDQDKVHKLRRASAATDLIGQALETWLHGDPASFDELLALNHRDFAERIGSRLEALSEVI